MYNVLITSPNTQNWQAFATWYSVREKLKTANTVLCLTQTEESPFMFFQWAKRLKIPHYFCKNQFSDPIANRLELVKTLLKKKFFNENLPLIILSELMIINNLNFEKKLSLDNNSGFLPNFEGLDDLINGRMLNNFQTDSGLSIEAKEKSEIHPVVSYKKGCGRWINTLRGCPFSNAAGLATEEMTTNEFLIINSWKQMAPLYQATA